MEDVGGTGVAIDARGAEQRRRPVARECRRVAEFVPCFARAVAERRGGRGARAPGALRGDVEEVGGAPAARAGGAEQRRCPVRGEHRRVAQFFARCP